jgi:hypothetical protein
MNKFAVLQSGFITDILTGLEQTQHEPSSEFMKSIMLGKPIKENRNDFLYSAEIDKVFAEFKADTKLVQKFEFREKFLKAVKNVMGDTIFFNWCSLQIESPHFSSLHKKFVLDTINFISTGNREINMETWGGLITAHGKTEVDEKVPYSIRTMRENNVYIGKAKMATIASNWFSRQNGVSDMIWFFGTVFGQNNKFVAG